MEDQAAEGLRRRTCHPEPLDAVTVCLSGTSCAAKDLARWY